MAERWLALGESSPAEEMERGTHKPEDEEEREGHTELDSELSVLGATTRDGSQNMHAALQVWQTENSPAHPASAA
jgi:hypothetical protein